MFAYSADCRKDAWANCYTLTFLAAIVWISAYSYMMVWMITVIGFTLNIPDTVMGLTFIAAGVSVPDALSGIAVIREGTYLSTYSCRLRVIFWTPILEQSIHVTRVTVW